MQDKIEIGRVLKPHGIKGEIKAQHFCDIADDFLAFEWVYLKNGNTFDKKSVLDIRTGADAVYLLLDGIATRNDAELLRGQMLYIDKSQVGELPKDVFLIRDLIGMTVATNNGEILGTLKEIFQTGPVDIYRVSAKDKAMMFPALKRVVVETNIEKKTIIVDGEALKEVIVHED